ncbi:MAG: hypothetical protein Q8S13_03195 [Dehalococcoidia bacterium]|nr:hypothetical protein [Dehalococcoidia bacterium]
MSASVRWGNPPTGVYNTPIYLGRERGRFGARVAVDVRDNRTGADYTEALVAGEFDMGHMGTPPLFAALARTDAYVVVGQGLSGSRPSSTAGRSWRPSGRGGWRPPACGSRTPAMQSASSAGA